MLHLFFPTTFGDVFTLLGHLFPRSLPPLIERKLPLHMDLLLSYRESVLRYVEYFQISPQRTAFILLGVAVVKSQFFSN